MKNNVLIIGAFVGIAAILIWLVASVVRLNSIPTQPPPITTQREEVITNVVAQTIPSVVTIGVEMTDSIGTLPFDPFGFQPLPQDNKQNIGSGFVATDNGLIITNKHVVSDPEANYFVITDDGDEYPVEKVYRDPLNDLAILSVSGLDEQPLTLGNSETAILGQTVIAIGNQLGEFNNTVTAGIISGLGRGIAAGSPLIGYVEQLDDVIQTDAAINPGNSGGPLLNTSAEVIGVNTAVAVGPENIGFAIPINTVTGLLTEFQARGEVFERPYLGVRYQNINERVASVNEIAPGAYVFEVIEDSPAADADIRPGDIITSFNGVSLQGENSQTLSQLIMQTQVGAQVTLQLWRDGETLSKEVALEASTS